MPPPAYHQFLVTAPLGRPVVAQGRSPGRLCAEPIGESGERCLLQMILTNIGYAIDATELSAVLLPSWICIVSQSSVSQSLTASAMVDSPLSLLSTDLQRAVTN